MRTAYVTTLCHGDGYLPGVEALGRSLDANGAAHRKVALVTPDVSDLARARLCAQGWALRDCVPITNPRPNEDMFFGRFRHTFTKLNAWSLTEYDKVVLLDADTIVLQNIDDLFDRPPNAAAPDFLLPDRFNSGVMVVQPSKDVFHRMLEALFVSRSYDGGDQGFLNAFFPDWYRGAAACRLPAGYNMHQFIYQFIRDRPYLREHVASEAKVVHYTVQKPWLATTTLAGGSEVWWDRYFEVHPERATEWKRRVHAMEDWSFRKALRAFLGWAASSGTIRRALRPVPIAPDCATGDS